jgi:hypothetical protein
MFGGLITIFMHIGGFPKRIWFNNASTMVTAVSRNVFYNEQMTGAIIDRVLHHCHLLLFFGPSNHIRESELPQ